ncbi:uncharacterized protein LOC141695747 [Apium graveolens]|uniref:uncharacterized protein LOC141695747 n=1 Tax=Apium graveolens TaxID=4045 RepID=UPI003D7A1AAE
MLKWAIELGQFDLEYCPRMEIKGQALADFILEFDSKVDDKAIVLVEPSSQGNSPIDEKEELPHPWWILYVNGVINNSGAGAGIVLVTPEGHHLMSAIHFKFYVTNNDAEYEALINGMKIALEVGVVNLIARSDSELVVNQVNGGFQARRPRKELYMRCAQRLLQKFGNARLEGIPREENSEGGARRELWQSLGGGSLALKVLRQGYYWTTMKEDAFKFFRACDRCQRFSNYSNALAMSITSLASPWPFAMWGVDLMESCLKQGGVKYAMVAMDYFTKWAEAMPLATIIAKKIRDFIFNYIVCCSVPYKLISENGKQFDSKELRKLCEDLNIKKDFAAVYHPQSNG